MSALSDVHFTVCCVLCTACSLGDVFGYMIPWARAGQVQWPPNKLTQVREMQALSTPWMLGTKYRTHHNYSKECRLRSANNIDTRTHTHTHTHTHMGQVHSTISRSTHQSTRVLGVPSTIRMGSTRLGGHGRQNGGIHATTLRVGAQWLLGAKHTPSCTPVGTSEAAAYLGTC